MTRNTFCLAAAVAALATSAAANGLKDQVVGTWELVSISANVNGEKIATFGDNPRGRQILAPSGHFVNLITAESLPLYAGANRLQGTPEEYAAIGKGSNLSTAATRSTRRRGPSPSTSRSPPSRTGKASRRSGR